MKFFKRRYRSKQQEAVLAGFFFSSVLIVIVALITFSARIPAYQPSDSVSHQDVLMAEAMQRMGQ